MLRDTRKAVRFPAPTRKEKHFYEGALNLTGALNVKSLIPDGIKRSAESYVFETQFGNITSMVDLADLDTPQDDVQLNINYSNCVSYVIKPVGMTVQGQGRTLRSREGSVDCSTGNVTQIRQLLEDGTAAVTDLSYTPDGNLLEVVSPPNLNSQRYRIAYEYDTAVQTYITRIDLLPNLVRNQHRVRG